MRTMSDRSGTRKSRPTFRSSRRKSTRSGNRWTTRSGRSAADTRSDPLSMTTNWTDRTAAPAAAIATDATKTAALCTWRRTRTATSRTFLGPSAAAPAAGVGSIASNAGADGELDREERCGGCGRYQRDTDEGEDAAFKYTQAGNAKGQTDKDQSLIRQQRCCGGGGGELSNSSSYEMFSSRRHRWRRWRWRWWDGEEVQQLAARQAQRGRRTHSASAMRRRW